MTDRVSHEFRSNIRLVPTTDSWHPTIFSKLESQPDQTHELDRPEIYWSSTGHLEYDRCPLVSAGFDKYKYEALARGLVNLSPPCKGLQSLARVAVTFTGLDDDMMQLELYYESLSIAESMFKYWSAWLSRLPYVSYSMLMSIGFNKA